MRYLLSKSEQFLFYFLLFAIPFQIRKILWHQSWNFNEWQSASIYGTDILLLILFVFWAFNYFKTRQFPISNFQFPIKSENLKSLIPNIKYLIQKPDFFLVLFIIISAVSIRNAISPQLAFYNWIKLLEFVLFYLYIRNYAVVKFGFANSLLVIIAGGLFQAVIAILQFLKQSDLGLRLLGESVIGLNMSGIASFYNMAGEKIIRAYGTTPHPNVLAAYLFLAIFAFYYLWIYKNTGKFYLFVFGVTLLAFFFTFARVAVFILFFNFLIRIILVRLKFGKEYCPDSDSQNRGSPIRKANREKLAQLFLTTFIVVSFFSVVYWPEAVSRVRISSREEAVQLRIFYNKESLKSLNWFGVGSGNFVNWLLLKEPNLPRNLYQPVHNIYLLIYSENGILGISAFAMFLVLLVKDFIVRTRMNKLHHFSFLLIFLSFLFLGLFDHFLLTLQQGRFMFWLAVTLLTYYKSGDIMIKQQSESTA